MKMAMDLEEDSAITGAMWEQYGRMNMRKGEEGVLARNIRRWRTSTSKSY